MHPTKMLAIATVNLSMATSVFADAAHVDYKQNLHDASYEAILADYGYKVGAAVYGKYDADYDTYLTNADVFLGPLGTHDADYEVILAERGIATGTAVYGQYDADYDAFLTSKETFDAHGVEVASY
ncbi:MAG: hypothetical protein AAFQ04_06330 [Pseudomonadota bacterium]